VDGLLVGAHWSATPPRSMVGLRCLLAVGSCALVFRTTCAYTVEELIRADHSVAVKLGVEEDRIEVLHGVLHEFLQNRKEPLEELCTSHTNIYHYADYTPLHYACLLDRDEHIRVLVKAGCSVELETDTGVRLLHAAAKEGSSKSFRTLLELGAGPMREAQEHMTAATLAAKLGHVAVLRAHKEFGGEAERALHQRDLNGAVSARGWAPIHYAASSGNRDSLNFLAFEAGALAALDDLAELIAATAPDLRPDVEVLVGLEVAEFENRRGKYLAELARKAGNEL